MNNQGKFLITGALSFIFGVLFAKSYTQMSKVLAETGKPVFEFEEISETLYIPERFIGHKQAIKNASTGWERAKVLFNEQFGSTYGDLHARLEGFDTATNSFRYEVMTEKGYCFSLVYSMDLDMVVSNIWTYRLKNQVAAVSELLTYVENTEPDLKMAFCYTTDMTDSIRYKNCGSVLFWSVAAGRCEGITGDKAFDYSSTLKVVMQSPDIDSTTTEERFREYVYEKVLPMFREVAVNNIQFIGVNSKLQLFERVRCHVLGETDKRFNILHIKNKMSSYELEHYPTNLDELVEVLEVPMEQNKLGWRIIDDNSIVNTNLEMLLSKFIDSREENEDSYTPLLFSECIKYILSRTE